MYLPCTLRQALGQPFQGRIPSCWYFVLHKGMNHRPESMSLDELTWQMNSGASANTIAGIQHMLARTNFLYCLYRTVSYSEIAIFVPHILNDVTAIFVVACFNTNHHVPDSGLLQYSKRPKDCDIRRSSSGLQEGVIKAGFWFHYIITFHSLSAA